jgi:hypothetical protein
MKMFNFKKIYLAIIAAAALALPTMCVAGDNFPAATSPPLAYGVPQILQLAQAKVSDDVIITYIHSSGNSYGLDADQIIYLKQQGISESIIIAMLNQPRPVSTPASSTTSAPQPANSYPAPAPAAYVQPATAYIQTASSPTVYVMPNSQPYYYTSTYSTYSTYQPYFYASYYPYYYHPYYARYCARPFSTASFSVGFGGGFHGVGFAGGFHGGTSFHGSSGGFHAGGMGGFHH